MQVSSASPWPLRVAYVAAAVFLGASGAINLTYGWQKGTEAELADVGRGLGRRRRGVCSRLAGSHPLAGRGPLVSHGRCGRSSPAAGSYSITAALGSAAGSRYNAASVEQSTTETRKSAQAAYDDFRAALADLAPSRPLGEVEAALAIARPSCRNTTLNGRRDVFCYLSAIGLEATPERLNDILTLLAVVIIEAGGGLAPALGLALSERPAEGSPERHRTQPETPNVSAIVQRPIVRPASVADWLAAHGGRATVSMRRLASELGCSPSSANGELRRLALVGALRVKPTPRERFCGAVLTNWHRPAKHKGR